MKKAENRHHTGATFTVDKSWILLIFLISWSFAQGTLPYYFPDMSSLSAWWLGFIGCSAVLLSVLMHELGHRIAEKLLHIPPVPVRLFLFGSVAEKSRNLTFHADLFQAIAGPLTNILLFIGFEALATVLAKIPNAEPHRLLAGRLSAVNLMIAGINMIPAFPLDGGRMLRAIILLVIKDSSLALRYVSSISRGLIFIMAAGGVYLMIHGQALGGMWVIISGLIVRDALGITFRFVSIRESMEGETVSRYMRSNPVTVPASATLKEFIFNYLYRFNFEMFPVIMPGRPVHYISTHEIRGIPVDIWENVLVNQVARECHEGNSVNPNDDVMKAVMIMDACNTGQLIVLSDTQSLEGILTVKDLMPFFAMKIDLSEYIPPATRKTKEPEIQPSRSMMSQPVSASLKNQPS